jgi:hypothetical protein
LRSKKVLLVENAADQAPARDALERRYRRIAGSGLTEVASAVETTAALPIENAPVGVVGDIFSRWFFSRELTAVVPRLRTALRKA